MRGTFLILLLSLAIALPAAAQEKAKPNTLTPKEIADGWILLFDGKTTFGWQGLNQGNIQNVDSKVTANDGTLMIANRAIARLSTGLHYFQLQAEYQSDSQPLLRTEDADITFFRPKNHMWFFGLENTDGALRAAGVFKPGSDKENWGQLTARFENKALRVDTRPTRNKTVQWNYELEKEFLPTTIQVRAPSLSNAAFGTPNFELRLRDIKLRPFNTKPLFNGKDLAGWKTFPGKKSQFTVADGAIHLKNGPGDLQTEGEYADFVLQLECKSNGKHLNSGVFFRCKANEYQNGYEAQIHNNFTADPAKEYTVEEFAPKTHELVEKKKVKSAATDFGTGAIYRRVPARSGVAKDGEWFTMTIVAHGNHFATWVNGIQQVDWYDNRPASDNPRTGFRKEAGHISIQGHDPTTDLSFRNIRIAELPK
jgi:hypothetical protein